jgi:hypothetical protein
VRLELIRFSAFLSGSVATTRRVIFWFGLDGAVGLLVSLFFWFGVVGWGGRGARCVILLGIRSIGPSNTQKGDGIFAIPFFVCPKRWNYLSLALIAAEASS